MLWVLIWTASMRIPPTAPGIKQWSIIREILQKWLKWLSLQIFSFTNEILTFILYFCCCCCFKNRKKNSGCSLELPLLSPVHKISLSNSKFLNKTHINGTLVWHSEYFHIYKIERCVYENVIFAPLLRLRQFSRISTIHALNKRKRKRKWRQWAGIYTIT